MAKRSKKPGRSVPDTSQDVSGTGVCFVIMPFGGWLDDYYKAIYCPAITAAGLEPHRADDLFRPSTIVNDIWAYTKRAKVLLADLTGKNPNVFYELGLAHALAKPVILVAEAIEDIPFDLRALRVILYDKNDPKWGADLQEKIENSLREILISPAQAVLPAFLDVKSAGEKPTVSPEQKDLIEIKQELDLLRREFRGRELRPPRNDIGALRAKELILQLINKIPPEAIVEHVSALGPPRNWVRAEIERIGRETAMANLASISTLSNSSTAGHADVETESKPS